MNTQLIPNPYYIWAYKIGCIVMSILFWKNGRLCCTFDGRIQNEIINIKSYSYEKERFYFVSLYFYRG